MAIHSRFRRLFLVLVGCLPVLPAAAADLQGNLTGLSQVRRGDQSRRGEVPTELYGTVSADRLHHGISGDTFFRVGEDLSRGRGSGDLYTASIRLPFRGLETSLGRQVLSDVPGGFFVVDGGRLRFDGGGKVGFSLFGGVPRYFEPLDRPDRLSQEEQMFGGSLRVSPFRHGNLTFGYLQQLRESRTLRQLVSLTMAQSLPSLPWTPSTYGAVAFDADRQSLDLGRAGLDFFVPWPRLSVNLEGGYYRPQDPGELGLAGTGRDLNRLEDPIFQLFSVSRLQQFRGGVRYAVLRGLSLVGDYSIQSYERTRGSRVEGQTGSVGLLWLPEGDGLEVVRAEYYVFDSDTGTVNGVRAYYENRYYRSILFRAKFDVGLTQIAAQGQDTLFSSRIGLGYLFASGFLAEVSFEANRNPRFREDYRAGLILTYNLRWRTGEGVQGPDPTRQRVPGGWAG